MMRKTLSSEKMPLKKGTWSPEEDEKLITYINRYGIWNWNEMPKAAGLSRSGKSCRLRWMNYLRPNIKHGNFTRKEEETIFKMHEMLGNRWSAIAAKLVGRTDNDIKNYWNTNVRKLLKKKATSTNILQEAKACGVVVSHPTFRGERYKTNITSYKCTVQVEATPEGNGGVFSKEFSKDLSTSSPSNELSSYELVSSFQSIGLSENLEGQSSFPVEGLHKIEDYYTEDTWLGEPMIFSNSFCDDLYDYSFLCSVNNLSEEKQSFYGQQFPLENEPYYSYASFKYPSPSSDELYRVIEENIELTGDFRGLWE